jgi:hypothetical protein
MKGIIFWRRLLLACTLIISVTLAIIAYSPWSVSLPSSCQDSDGDCNIANVNAADGTFEQVDLLTYPYGWLNATMSSVSIPDQNTVDNATLHVTWKTDTGVGAGDINVDYWDGSSWTNCAGPLSENETVSDTSCNVSQLTKSQLNSLKVRFRGEDTDGFPNAFGYVDIMYLDVNHSAPPLWTNQSTNASGNVILNGGAIKLSSRVYDDVGLSYAWLSTNESGNWTNTTAVYLGGIKNQWAWANFTWKNDSFASGIVGWKVFINDTTGKVNATDIEVFLVQYRIMPGYCQDSDGDCNYLNINNMDDVFETVDLLTYPFGWINSTSWSSTMPDDASVSGAVLHVIWKTDAFLGAENINIDYWSGSSWTNCAGPLSENETVSDTSCNVSQLTKSQLNSLKVRFRGEDTDGFPNAFGYVDAIYLEANYSTGAPYLEVQLAYPEPAFTTNVIQNLTFVVNATVYCRSNSCGNVNATLRYNMTTQNPDTDVNTTTGDRPFFIQEASASATKYCPSNPLEVNEFCNITWLVNTTGDNGEEWKLGVVFESDDNRTMPAGTANATVSILACTEDFSINWNSLDFGFLDPYTGPDSAAGNADNRYNISINPGSCDIDIYLKGTNLTNTTLNSKIDVGRILWSNTTNDPSSAYNMTEELQPVRKSAVRNTNITTWYWINVPAIYAGKYNGILTVTGIRNV